MAQQAGRKIPEKQGSMTLFWAVMGVAAVLLVSYVVVMGLRMSNAMPSLEMTDGDVLPAESRKDVPSFHLEEISGGPDVGSDNIGGQVVVIHVWASWCPPCRSEFPSFARYAAEEVPEGVVVAAVSLDKDAAASAAYVQGVGRPVRVYWKGGQNLASKLGVSTIPSTILVDRQGRIAYKASGVEDWGGGGIPALVDQLVDEF